MIEVDIHERAPRVRIGIGRRHRSFSPGSAHADALVPFLFLDGTTVDFYVDVVVLENDPGDANRVAILSCRPKRRNQLRQLRATGGHNAVVQF